MFDIGMPELIVIFIVALLVFGPKRLPEIGKTIGKGMAELRKAMHGVKEQMDAELYKVEHPIEKPDDKNDKETEKISKVIGTNEEVNKEEDK